jgi:hypothetical protein
VKKKMTNGPTHIRGQKIAVISMHLAWFSPHIWQQRKLRDINFTISSYILIWYIK